MEPRTNYPSPRRRRKWLPLLSVLLTIPVTGAVANEGETLFKQHCTSCHSIGGGRLVGPDLKGVQERQSREWLVGFISDPGKYLATDDYAKKILKEANGIPMPKLPGITPQKAGLILDYINSVEGSAAPATDAAAADTGGVHEGDWTWYTKDNVQAGRDLFTGRTALSNGAPACTSCHASAGGGILRNGSLGPDLTSVYARLGSRRGLKAWLSSPPTSVMSSVFADKPLTAEEIDNLSAFFADNNTRYSDSGILGGIVLGVTGGYGAFLLLAAMDLTWRRRLGQVRETLISLVKKGKKS